MRRITSVLCVLLAIALTAEARELTIVADGAPAAAIVAEKDQPKADKAAKALQAYILKMSGAKLPIVVDGEAVGKGMIGLHVGHTAVAKRKIRNIPAGFDPTPRPEAFEEEGFVLKTSGKRVIIAGNNDGPYKGTIFAVYRLLEMLGCRWYFPGQWGEIIPKNKTVVLPDLDVRCRPDFAVRHNNAGGWVPVSKEERAEFAEWAERIGYTEGGLYPLVGDGFLSTIVHPQEYYKSNPDWFAMAESGERKAYWHSAGWYYDRHTMLCLSNEDMYKEAVKNLRLAFAGEKKMNIVSAYGFGISPPDGVPYCFCKKCKGQSLNFEYSRYVHRVTQSEEFFGFAARLAREFPDKFVSTMAYSLREIVPQGVDIPANVMVKIAPISCDVKHPNDSKLWRRRDFVRNLKQWRKHTPHITIYDYNPGMLLGSWLPERDVANMAINAPIYREIGLKGFTREGRKAFMQTWISYYVFGKLMWDADADVAAIKADFYNTFFGPEAGPHVQAWWDAHEERLVNDPMQAHEDFFVNHIYTPEFARELVPHVEAAGKAKKTAEQEARFKAFELIHRHFMAFVDMTAAEKAMDWAKASAAAARMTEAKHELKKIWSFFIGVHDPPRAYFIEGRKLLFDELHSKTNGEKGDLVYNLPLEMKFTRDPFNEGIIGGWHEPNFDDSAWNTKNTFYTWDQQDEPEDAAGHDWDGIGWYRAGFTVDSKFKRRPLKFWCGGTINEGWVWINGKYAGHCKRHLWWSHPHYFELDVTDLVKPGRKNTIAIRVLNNAEIGGLFRRGFIWAGKK